jgi:hypothetical protein
MKTKSTVYNSVVDRQMIFQVCYGKKIFDGCDALKDKFIQGAWEKNTVTG